VKEFQRQFDRGAMPYMVMDAAFYSRENLQECRQMRWVTRVPETLKEVREHFLKLDIESMAELAPGYRYVAVPSSYAGVDQRWLIVRSEQACEREMKTFEKNLEKERDRNAKDLKHLRNEVFACEADAEKAARRFAKRLRHQRFDYTIGSRKRYAAKGRPAKGARAESVEWLIGGTLSDNLEVT
jgi:transposase